ncbi:MAG: hypothetical protein PHE55_21130 [Methylococcaceae bacterium]|nr:hypothetical protein [Methylococcaceae bacterium]
MNKKTLTLTLGGAIAASFMAAPVVNAAENPFSMQAVGGGLQVAEASKKAKEGKCGEGKCSSKMKAGKMKEGGCSASKTTADKMKEGGCSASKMKEGGCSGNMKADEPAQ